MIRSASDALAIDVVVDPAAEPLLLDVVARILLDISQRSAADCSAGNENRSHQRSGNRSIP